jgi:hypothetical protein
LRDKMASLYAPAANTQIRARARALPELGPAPVIDRRAARQQRSRR